MTDRRSGIDRRYDWQSWILPQIEDAIAQGRTADEFVRGYEGRRPILAPWRVEVKEFFEEVLRRPVAHVAAGDELPIGAEGK